jgi:hypothetical protein
MSLLRRARGDARIEAVHDAVRLAQLRLFRMADQNRDLWPSSVHCWYRLSVANRLLADRWLANQRSR